MYKSVSVSHRSITELSDIWPSCSPQYGRRESKSFLIALWVWTGAEPTSSAAENLLLCDCGSVWTLLQLPVSFGETVAVFPPSAAIQLLQPTALCHGWQAYSLTVYLAVAEIDLATGNRPGNNNKNNSSSGGVPTGWRGNMSERFRSKETNLTQVHRVWTLPGCVGLGAE